MPGCLGGCGVGVSGRRVVVNSSPWVDFPLCPSSQSGVGGLRFTESSPTQVNTNEVFNTDYGGRHCTTRELGLV